jgi:ABC-type polysaccharide/polyol phosphate export permease
VTLTQAIVITALAIWWMGVKVLGQPAHLLIYYTLGTFAFIVLGAAIGVLVPSIQGARGLAQASYMFMVFLGGAFYGLPGSLEHLTLWLPLSLFLRGFRQLFSEGAGLVQVLGPALGLLGWMAIGLLALGLARAREAHDA